MAPNAKFSQTDKLSLHELWRVSGDKMLRRKLDIPSGNAHLQREGKQLVK